MAIEKRADHNYGFPSHMVSPAIKKTKKWNLQYIKAFHKEFTVGDGKVLRWAYEDYERWRLYGRGKQPIDQYKELLGVKKRQGKRDPSWRNLDWNILPIMPRIKSVIKNRILKQPHELLIRPIDQVSVTKERHRRAEILEYMANQPFIERVGQQLGIEPLSPFEPGEPVPANSNEVDLYLQMYPKNQYVLELIDQIALAKSVNDWPQVEEELVDDLIDVGIGGTYTWIDNQGVIRTERVVPERTITNACVKNDFSDLIRVGQYKEMTVSNLRQMVPKGTFTEEQYAKMAGMTSGRAYNVTGSEIYYELNNRYPWDHERITVLVAEWYSADDVAYVIDKDPFGRLNTITKKTDPYWLNKKNISDQEYVDFHKASGRERELVRDSVNNVYRCSWIVGTDYIFDFGPKSNMIRAITSLGDCELGYTFYTLDFDSPMRQCEPVLDNIQYNWLQFQHQLAQSRPKGIAIERRAISQVEFGSGKNKLKLSPENILRMYSETGSYIYVGTDAHGRPYPFKPIEELMGGISDAAAQHLQFLIQDIDLLRSILGLNEVTDASSVDARMNKLLAELSEGATNNALGTIVHAFNSIHKRTAKKISLLVPDAEGMGVHRGKQEALGEYTHQFFLTHADAAFMEFSIDIDVGIDMEMKQRLMELITANSKDKGGLLLPEDIFLVQNEKNIYRAFRLLAQKRRLREQEAHQQQIALMQTQTQGNTDSAIAVEQEKRKTKQEEIAAYEMQKFFDTQSEIATIREEKFWELLLEKMRQQKELTTHESELYNALLRDTLKARTDLEKTNILANSRDKVRVRA